jgi:hypothetical protein
MPEHDFHAHWCRSHRDDLFASVMAIRRVGGASRCDDGELARRAYSNACANGDAGCSARAGGTRRMISATPMTD